MHLLNWSHLKRLTCQERVEYLNAITLQDQYPLDLSVDELYRAIATFLLQYEELLGFTTEEMLYRAKRGVGLNSWEECMWYLSFHNLLRLQARPAYLGAA